MNNKNKKYNFENLKLYKNLKNQNFYKLSE